MTVETTVSRAGPYAGAGTVGPFPVPFRFLENAHLRLIKTLPDGTNSDLVLDVDYSVAGAGDDTGSVTLAAPLFAQYKLTILRNVPATQEADYVENDPFPAESHERALDKLTMIVQQQGESLGRALTVPATDPSVSLALPGAALRARRYLSFDNSGRPVATTFDVGEVARQSQAAIDAAAEAKDSSEDAAESALEAKVYADYVREESALVGEKVNATTPNIVHFTGDGSTVEFALPSNPGSKKNLIVSIDGVLQHQDAFDVTSGSDRLVFAEAPSATAADNIEVRIAPSVMLTVTDAQDMSFVGPDGIKRNLGSYLREGVSKSVFSFPILELAQAAAATLPDGQRVLSEYDEVRGVVNAGAITQEQSIYAVVDYAKIHSYTGRGTRLRVVDPTGAHWWVRNGTASDNGGTVLKDAPNRSWVREYSGSVDARWFGLAGDGSTDDTTNAQKAIDASRGGHIIFPAGRKYLMAGVTMVGSTYDNTHVTFEGEMVLKPAPTATSETYEGAWFGLLIKDNTGVTLDFRGDGNRTAQPDFEHVHLVGVAGAKNIKIPSFYGREVRGDGLYIGASKWREASANTSGQTIGLIEVINSVNDGRNALSIISGDNITVDCLRSSGVGATVGGFVQPGGLDIEPNHAWESCKNIAIGTVNVVTAGTNGLAILGRPGADVTRNVTVGAAVVTNVCNPSVADANSAITQTNNHTLVVGNATSVTVGNYRGSFLNAYGDAVVVTNSSDVKIDGSVRHVREGARIGLDVDDATGPGVIGSNINLIVTDIARHGFLVGKMNNTKVAGVCTYPTQAHYPGGVFGVVATTYTQVYSIYSVDIRQDDNWTRTYRQGAGAPATFLKTSIKDCDCSGFWPSGSYVNMVGDMPIPRYNVVGVTDQPTVPQGTSLWAPGQYVRNNAPEPGQPKGWFYSGGAWVSEGSL